jgi:peptide/nickel transport system ATP-binding protein
MAAAGGNGHHDAGGGDGREPVLSVRDLEVDYVTPAGVAHAVRGVGFDLHRNESIALIGESGCGKTTLGAAILRLLPKGGRVVGGEVLYRRRDGRELDVLALGEEGVRRFRWEECAMVFQAALNSLNPVLRVWDQMLDTVRAHRPMPRDEVRARSVRLLRMVQLEPERVLNAYPHELSGGMRQRVVIAMSLLLDPQVIVYDEPTTALDILTQRAIIEVLRSLRETLDFSMIFISHDLPLAAELADRVATMYAGRIIELADVREAFYDPRHPYTLGLLKAVPPVVGDLYEIASIPGAPPSLINLPSGCTFHPRCPYARERCHHDDPPLYDVDTPGHLSACHYWQEVHLEREVVATGD